MSNEKTPTELSPICSLSSHDVHLWILQTDPISFLNPEVLKICRTFLDPEEILKEKQITLETIRNNYLITRFFCRSVLSKYVPILPSHWKFSTNDFGKPEICNHYPGPPLYFNLSHCKGMIVCLVGLCKDIGVDIEYLNRESISYLDLAQRFFSKKEFEILKQTPAHHQKESFFKYWTLKEAYTKARGSGLSLPLSDFSFCLANEEIKISFSESFRDRPELWRFELFQPTSDHVLALATRKQDDSQRVHKFYLNLLQ